MSSLAKITSIWRHIEEVQKNCFIIAEKLIANGEDDLARQLLTNSLVHDQSKLQGIEWMYLHSNDDSDEAVANRKLAIHQHNSVNPHHPEHWRGGIKNMPTVFLIEMVADWKSRSSDFGTSLQEWIDNGAAKRFNYTKKTKVYRDIMKYTNMLVERPFQQ